MTLSTADRAGQPGLRDKQRGRTRSALLAAAARLLAAGTAPTVAEVADAADVSRRTAYRYFATQEQMLVESALEALRPRIEDEIAGGGPSADPNETTEARLDRAVRALQRNAVENEALLRTMIRLTVGPFDASAEPQPDAPLRRGYRRIEWIGLAIEPEKSRLGARRYARLVSALTVCLGIDALVVLRDLCGLSPAAAESVTRWAAQALLRASLAEADEDESSAPVRPRAKGRKPRR